MDSCKIVGLDISTQTGVCNLTAIKTDVGGVEYEYGTKAVTSKKNSKTPENNQARIKDITDSIMNYVYQHEPDFVVVEGYSFASKFTSFMAVELSAIIRYRLYQDDVDFMLVPPTTLKKFVTGKGNAKKEIMRLETYKRWGVERSTNDEIDAYALAMLGAAYMGLITGMPKKNMEVFSTNDLTIIRNNH